MSRRLNRDEIAESLRILPGWTLSGEAIRREYVFRDFREAMEFVNRVADEAEAANHHPDMDIRYNRVVINLSTHSEGGVTAQDTHLAHQIEAAALPNL